MMFAGDKTSTSLVGTSPEAMSQIIRGEDDAYGMDHCEIGAYSGRFTGGKYDTRRGF